MYDSSYHENAFVFYFEFSDHGCRDLSIDSFDHDYDFSTVDFLSHRSLTIPLLMKWNFPKLLRHFIQS